MPIQNIHVIAGVLNNEELSNELAKHQKVVRYMLNGNIDFENIRARSIKAANIEVGAITADEIATHSITADKMNVNELSAITANLGEIIAGIIRGILIYGSYIATSENAYPRVEIDPLGNLIGIYTDENNYMRIFPGITGAPGISVVDSGNTVLTIGSGFGLSLLVSPGSMFVESTNGNLYLECGPGVLDFVNVPSWDKFYGSANGESLQDALDGKQNTISGYTGSVNVVTSVNFTNQTVSTDTLNFTDGILTSVT